MQGLVWFNVVRMFDEQKSLDILRKRVKNFPELVVILGSGWNKVLKMVAVEQTIAYKDLFGMTPTVLGHKGQLVIGKMDHAAGSSRPGRVAFMSGRFHMYEGLSAHEVTVPMRVFGEMGMKKLVICASSGALNERYRVGDFVVMSDLVTLFLAIDNPLVGPRFQDLSEVFDGDMKRLAGRVCVDNNIDCREGVYVYYHGPNYETPADKMALRFLGADCVGMSVVPEALVAKTYGVEVLGLAVITNLAFVKHSHKEVVAQANKASGRMTDLLAGVVAGI